jgi:hypothetical protein
MIKVILQNLFVGFFTFSTAGVALADDALDLSAVEEEIADALAEADNVDQKKQEVHLDDSAKENSKQVVQETPQEALLEKAKPIVSKIADKRITPETASVSYNEASDDGLSSLKNLRIDIPKSWTKVESDSSMLVMNEKKNGLQYQKSISVKYFDGERDVNLTTGKEVAEYVNDYYGVKEGVSEYSNDKLEEVELADGRMGVAFYSTYYLDDIAMMQVHLLVSEANAHYVATYTDLHETMSKSNSSSLDQAWGTLLGITIEPGNVIVEPIVPIKPIIVSVLALLSSLLLLNTRKMVKLSKAEKITEKDAEQDTTESEIWVVKKSEFPYLVSELEKFDEDDEQEIYTGGEDLSAYDDDEELPAYDDEELPPLPVEAMDEDTLRSA